MSAAVIALLLSLALSGCASLPPPGPRPVSTALADFADTPLARIAAAAASDDERHLSGFRPLMDGDHALDARIALIRRAQKSLDLQYYLIASDEVGLMVLRELRDAAARGVRVRLLVDDLYAAGQDELFAGLATHANVELRLFNPLPARGDAFATRIVRSLHEFRRINRRMHNKLFIADNAFAIVGGRNIANEYFMRGESANFIDADVLATGPVVRRLSAVFDTYWNSEQAWPVQSLVGNVPDARASFDALVSDAAADPLVTPRDRFGRSSVHAQLDSGHLEQRFAAAEVFADTPAKAAGAESAEGSPMAAAMSAMGAARSDVLIVSPYFVPGESGMATLQKALDKQVRLTVVTNSLSATDEPLAHWGYARYRTAMLKMGVSLRELGARLSGHSSAFGDFNSSLARLHAKLAVVDQQRLFIGSMNMDRRSARLNTELLLAIDSHELSSEIASLLTAEEESLAYRLRLAGDGERIEWLSGDRVQRSEPHCGWGLRLKLATLSAFVDEEML